MKRVRLVLWLVLLCGVVPSQSWSQESWDFISVNPYYLDEPTWRACHGKAQVEFRDRHVKITAQCTIAPDDPYLGQFVFEGVLRANMIVEATCVLVATDARPFKVTGRYIVREDVAFFGTTKGVIRRKEIVFPYPQNSRFFGFVSQEVRKELIAK
jgi:hypothetical protein